MYSPIQIMPKFLNYLKSINDSRNRNCDLIYFMEIKGGWEKWLQLEFSNFLRKEYNNTATEVTIKDVNDTNIGRADIEISLRYTNKPYQEKMLIELKCQTSVQKYGDVIKGLIDDINKLRTCQAEWKYTIAFMRYSNANYNMYAYSQNYPYLNDIIDIDGVKLSEVSPNWMKNGNLQGVEFEKTAQQYPLNLYNGIAALCYTVDKGEYL